MTTNTNPEGDPHINSGLKASFLLFVNRLKHFLSTTLSIREGTDVQGTIEEVTNNLSFRGPAAWILICSILIASIGLNINSTAVIIGAMLISPLMAPIIGIGLSVSINDLKLLRRSVKNFLIMVIISLITSFIYFYITPLSEAQSELFARIKPTLLDVLLATFGGMAGIIAGSRDEKSNVIPGVAIATALMPPLCTAGYGLATWNMEFFFGAFYLFLLNSVFICLSTIIVVRYLKFPLTNFINPEREKRVKRWIAVITLLIIIPSGIIFWNIIQQSIYETKVDSFVTQYMSFENTEVVSSKIIYTDSVSTLEVFLIGEIISDIRIKELNTQMLEFGLQNTRLKVNQAKDDSYALIGSLTEGIRTGIIEDLYQKNEELIQSKEEQIRFLEQQLLQYKGNDINYEDFKNELQAVYENIEHFSFAKMIGGNYSSDADTVFTFLVAWNEQLTEQERSDLNGKLGNYLKARFKLDKVRVVNE